MNKVSDIVPHWAARTPDAVALVEGKRSWSYAELDRAIRETNLDGVRPGDRVMLICENRLEDVANYFACTALGAWPIVVNAKLTVREIDEIRAHSGARLVLKGAETTLYHDAVPEGGSDVAALIYTSGTTGKPKGVMLTHDNLMFVARASGEARRFTPGDRVSAVLPISHILGLTGVLLGALLHGASVHLFPRFDPAQVLAADPSVMIGTPSMYQMLSEYMARKSLAPGARLRLITSAGAPLDMATKTAAQAAFGMTLHNGYGITECSPTITLTRLDEPRADCGIGQVLAGVETRLVDGELFVRSPGVMKGYYRAPDETAAAIDAEGWFRTGDLARFEDGSWSIVGRAKEMIIRFGFNVYPAEIEGVLNGHPSVARSAVIGRTRAGSEEVVAFVEAPGANAAELAAYAAERLAPYKRPSEFRFVDALPLSPTGKILKSTLAALA